MVEDVGAMEDRPTATLVAVVDDDDLICNSIADLLMSAGIESCTFSSAEAFLASSEIHEVGCLITDIRMAGMTGLELQRQLTADHSWLPIIFITALGDTQLRVQALRAGAVEFLLKPVDDKVLLHSVQVALKCVSSALGPRESAGCQ
jgi:FixJ family two-component response regulator